MKIIDIWTLDKFHTSYNNIEKESKRLGDLIAARAIKYSISVLWAELAMALDELCLEEVKKESEHKCPFEHPDILK